MMKGHKMKNITFVSACLMGAFLSSGCVPVALIGGAVTGAAIAEERGIGTSVKDAEIKTRINALWFKHDPDMHALLNITVREGHVLITGNVDSSRRHIDAIRLAWQVNGVKEVVDEIKEKEDETIGSFAKDTWISTQLKSKMLFNGDIKSINYTVRTVEGTIYLMGIAGSQHELDELTRVASNIPGVVKVVTLVRIKDNSQAAM